MKLLKKEKEIENEILDYLSQFPSKLKVWKVETVGVFDPCKKIFRKKHNKHYLRGTPDIQGYLKTVPPIPLYIEVKSKTGKLSPEQTMFLFEASRDGCIAFMARSVDEVRVKLYEFCLSIGQVLE